MERLVGGGGVVSGASSVGQVQKTQAALPMASPKANRAATGERNGHRTIARLHGSMVPTRWLRSKVGCCSYDQDHAYPPVVVVGQEAVHDGLRPGERRPQRMHQRQHHKVKEANLLKGNTDHGRSAAVGRCLWQAVV